MVIRRLLAVASGGLVLLTGAACTAPPSPSVAAASPAPPHQVSVAGRQRPAGHAAGSITLAFAGDVNFAGRTRRLLADPATAFGPVTAALRTADFTAVNLETAITSGGTPQPKTYHFRAPATAFTALRDAGIDLVTMANNHVLGCNQSARMTAELRAFSSTSRPSGLRACLGLWPEARSAQNLT